VTKHKSYHNIKGPMQMLQHGQSQGIGPMFNVRHPKKLPPLMKKTAPSAANTESGKQTQHDEQSN